MNSFFSFSFFQKPLSDVWKAWAGKFPELLSVTSALFYLLHSKPVSRAGWQLKHHTASFKGEKLLCTFIQGFEVVSEVCTELVNKLQHLVVARWLWHSQKYLLLDDSFAFEGGKRVSWLQVCNQKWRLFSKVSAMQCWTFSPNADWSPMWLSLCYQLVLCKDVCFEAGMICSGLVSYFKRSTWGECPHKAPTSSLQLPATRKDMKP